MEPLQADSLNEARQEAQRLLTQHCKATAARIYLDDMEVDVLRWQGRGLTP